ncbi:MAG TPA: protein kinase [Fimbriiglobus sp.]
MTACPPPDQLRALLSAAVTRAEADTIETHIQNCPECLRLLDVLSDDPKLQDWRDGKPNTQDFFPTTAAGTTVAARGFPLPLDPPRRPGDLGSLGTNRIEAVVGRGGMGVVFRGWDEALNRPVAVKVLRPDLDLPQARERFVLEARAAAGLHNDHVVAVYGVFNPPAGVPYFTMELLTAPPLSERIGGKPLPSREAAEAIAQASDGVAAAHAAGLIHRDIKPANILTDPATGRVKVADFGLARDAAVPSSLTQEGSVVGTPHYLSPEQAAGGSESLDARADVYSLGATLYETLTGSPPFRGTPLAVLRQVQTDTPVPVRRLNGEVSPDLEVICSKAMAKDPGRRYANAGELRDDLRRWLSGRPITARPAGPIERSLLWGRRNPLVVAVVAVSVLGFAASTWGWWQAGKQTDLARIREGEAVSARESATEKAKLAEDRAVLALGTINTLVIKAQQLAGTTPGTLPLRQQLAEAALADLQKLAATGNRIPGADRTSLVTHQRLGDTLNLLGRSREAVKEWETAVAQAEALANESPSDPSPKRDLARLCVRIAYVHRRLNEPGRADEWLRRAVATLEAAESLAPHDKEAEREFEVALNARADLSLERSRYRNAINDYKRALVKVESLVAADPNRVLYQSDLRYTHARLGAVYELVLDCPAADRHYQAAEAAAAKALNLDPSNPAVKRDWLISLLDRADALAHTGDFVGAEKASRDALKNLEPVARADTGNALTQRDLAVGFGLLGIALVGQNKLDLGAKSLESSLAIRESILRQSPGSALVAADIPIIVGLVIYTAERRGKFADAAHWCEHAIDIVRALHPDVPDPSTAATIANLTNWKQVYDLAPKAIADPTFARKQKAELAPRLCCVRAYALARKGDFADAIASIEAARTTFPSDFDVLVYHALLHSYCAGETTDETYRKKWLATAVQSMTELAKKNPVWVSNCYCFPELIPVRSDAGFEKVLAIVRQEKN